MPGSYIKSYKVFERIKKVGLYVSGITIFIMMSFIVIDVFMRTVFHSSILGSFEFVQYYLMPLAVFPALAYTWGSGILPRINIYISRTREQFQRTIAVILLFVELLLFVLLTYFGWEYAMKAFTESISFTAGGKMYPLYPVIFFVPVGFGFVILEIIFLLMKNLKQKEVSFKVLEDE